MFWGLVRIYILHKRKVYEKKVVSYERKIFIKVNLYNHTVTKTNLIPLAINILKRFSVQLLPEARKFEIIPSFLYRNLPFVKLMFLSRNERSFCYLVIPL